MNAQIITAIAAEDENGIKVNPTALNAGLRIRHLDGWTGRDDAIDEIVEVGCVDYEMICDEPDATIASHLLIARCEIHDDLPSLSVGQAAIVPA